MAKYKYRAMNTQKEIFEGTKEAESTQEVIDFIGANGYYPLLVEEVIESKEINIEINKKVKLRDISVFCRQFYTMLDAGVPILRCLEILASQTENKILKDTLKVIQKDVERGEPLSDSMKKHEKIFPELLISLVEAGEASGNLDKIMQRMSMHYEKESKTVNKVKTAMIYPVMLSIIATLAVIFILVFVMPTFKEIFEQTGADLPWSTQLLLNSGDFLKNNALILIIIAGLIGFLIKRYLNTEKGKVFKSEMALKIPALNKLNQMNIVSRFTRTMSVLLASGMPLMKSLEIVSNVVENRVAQKALRHVESEVSKGESFNTAIRETDLFPQMLYSMIEIGENTGALDDILNKTADFYDEELDTTIQSTVALMEPILIVVMGLVVGFIIMSVMLPLYESYGSM